MTRRGSSWGGVQRVAAIALAVLSLGFVALRAATSPEFPLLVQDPAAPWIAPSSPVSADLEQWGHQEAPRVVFSRVFGVGSPPTGAARLVLRALGGFRVALNGEPLAAGEEGRDWRRPARIEIGERLRTGRNELRVEVRNRRGPALLSLRSEGLDPPLASDRGWEVEVDGRPRGTSVVADDTRVNPAALAVETPRRAARRLLVLLLGIWAAGAVGLAVLGRVLPASLRERLPLLAFAAAALAWLALFARKFSAIPVEVGFDARHHLAYLAFLRERHALPLATDGWSMYHPPLFYAGSWLLAWIGDQIAAGPPRLSLKWIPFLCGFGNVAVAWALARRVIPEDGRVPLVAVLFAAVLPMNLYLSAYFSNEMPHALLVGASLVVGVGLLRAPRASARGALGLGALLGLAMLTKFTAMIVLPLALFFLALKIAAVEQRGVGTAVGLASLVALAALAVSGWFYARTWLELGAPVVGNWNAPGPDRVWWQQPGFHTPAYYLGFGESLRHPYLAGFHSFWDGIYSTLWGDGGIGGRVFPIQRHGFWNYDFMSAGFLLALPATALVVLGALRGVRLALSDPDPGRRAALSFLASCAWIVGLAVLYLTLQLPFFAQAKAFYGLCMVGPLALFAGLGTARCDDWLARLPGPAAALARPIFHGWLVMTAAVFLLSFLI